MRKFAHNMDKRAFFQLNRNDQEIVEQALNASRNAYAPYSQFAVGAAILTDSGSIYRGANFENASLGLSICAEVSALAAFHMSDEKNDAIKKIAVIGHSFGKSREPESIVTPCGRCRQLILEVAQLSRRDIIVLSCNASLTQILPLTISELLPLGFGPQTFCNQVDQKQAQIDLRTSVDELVKLLPARQS